MRLTLAMAALLSCTSAVDAQKRQTTVEVLEGEVTATNVERIIDWASASNGDRIIGFDIWFDQNDEPRIGGCDERQFVVHYVRGGVGAEMLANEGWSLTRGYCRLQGFFMVVQGSMNSGIISVPLEKVPAALVKPMGMKVVKKTTPK